MEHKHITLAWDDGSIHRLTFTTNAYGVSTAALYAVSNDGKLESVHGAQHMPASRTTRDGTELFLLGDRNGPVGTYKYDLKIFVPLSNDFLDSGQAPIQGDLRWGRPRTAHGFIELD